MSPGIANSTWHNKFRLKTCGSAPSRLGGKSPDERTRRAFPSEIDTFYRLHTVNGVFQDPEALRMYDRMRELEATGEHTTAKSSVVLEAESSRHIPCLVRSQGMSISDDLDEELQTVPYAFALKISFPSDMSLGKILPPWHQFLDQKIRGAHFSLGIVAGERFAIELTPSTFPQRHFAGDMFPQRHVAGEKVGMLLGKASNVVVPFEIVEHVGPVAYRLKLPQELSCVHDTFHVSNLKKRLAEPDVQVPLDEIKIDENLRFVKEPFEIVERDVKKLKRRRIPLVKVRWNSRQGVEYTWEHEDQFRKKYPHLFSEPVPSSNGAT
ncbi:hypothetical protein Tco_1316209 [Tanacetum coccineum]